MTWAWARRGRRSFRCVILRRPVRGWLSVRHPVKQNWAREIAVVSPDASILVIEGAAPIPLTAEWVIVSYDILGRHIDDLLRMPWAALVFDEAHYLKNHTSARMQGISRAADDLRRGGNARSSPCSC